MVEQINCRCVISFCWQLQSLFLIFSIINHDNKRNIKNIYIILIIMLEHVLKNSADCTLYAHYLYIIYYKLL